MRRSHVPVGDEDVPGGLGGRGRGGGRRRSRLPAAAVAPWLLPLEALLSDLPVTSSTAVTPWPRPRTRPPRRRRPAGPAVARCAARARWTTPGPGAPQRGGVDGAGDGGDHADHGGAGDGADDTEPRAEGGGGGGGQRAAERLGQRQVEAPGVAAGRRGSRSGSGPGSRSGSGRRSVRVVRSLLSESCGDVPYPGLTNGSAASVAAGRREPGHSPGGSAQAQRREYVAIETRRSG